MSEIFNFSFLDYNNNDNSGIYLFNFTSETEQEIKVEITDDNIIVTNISNNIELLKILLTNYLGCKILKNTNNNKLLKLFIYYYKDLEKDKKLTCFEIVLKKSNNLNIFRKNSLYKLYNSQIELKINYEDHSFYYKNVLIFIENNEEYFELFKKVEELLYCAGYDYKLYKLEYKENILDYIVHIPYHIINNYEFILILGEEYNINHILNGIKTRLDHSKVTQLKLYNISINDNSILKSILSKHDLNYNIDNMIYLLFKGCFNKLNIHKVEFINKNKLIKNIYFLNYLSFGDNLNVLLLEFYKR